jgi:rod shape determining protein RodA
MKLTEHKYMKNFDWALFGSVGVILVIGLLNLYSTTYGLTLSKYFVDQIIWIMGGIVVMFLVSLVDYHFFNRYAYFMYGLTMLMLILVFFIGRSANGSQRWIHLGFFNIQPSEIIKISVVLVLARYFQDHQEKRTMGTWDLVAPMLLTIPPFILVLKQPDLGTSLIVLSAAVLMIWFAGVQRRILITTIVLFLISMPIIWKFGLHDYQRDRVISFLDPEKYASGKGYQVTQAKIAIGSGRFSGKGYLNGSQSKLQFLPKQHTDFVYSNFGEEFGFLGSVFLFFLYIVFFSGLLQYCCERTRCLWCDGGVWIFGNADLSDADQFWDGDGYLTRRGHHSAIFKLWWNIHHRLHAQTWNSFEYFPSKNHLKIHHCVIVQPHRRGDFKCATFPNYCPNRSGSITSMMHPYGLW